MTRQGFVHFAMAAMLALGGAACSELGTVEGGDDDDDTPIDETPEAVSCMAELMVTGTLTPPGTPPAADAGCIPIGTWTVDVQLVDAGDCESVDFLPQYVYTITGDIDNGYEYVYTADPTSENVFMKVTQGGPGDCEGSFEHYAADGMSMVLLKPHERELAISGHAYFETYTEPAL